MSQLPHVRAKMVCLRIGGLNALCLMSKKKRTCVIVAGCIFQALANYPMQVYMALSTVERDAILEELEEAVMEL